MVDRCTPCVSGAVGSTERALFRRSLIRRVRKMTGYERGVLGVVIVGFCIVYSGTCYEDVLLTLL